MEIDIPSSSPLISIPSEEAKDDPAFVSLQSLNVTSPLCVEKTDRTSLFTPRPDDFRELINFVSRISTHHRVRLVGDFSTKYRRASGNSR